MAPRKRLVYVEDNAANFALAKRVLESTSAYEVVQAEDGRAGRALIESSQPDAILLDLDLPDMNGLQLVRELKAHKTLWRIPIIVITASVMQRERSRAIEAGCDHFLEKPFDIDVLRGLVDSVTGGDSNATG